MKDSGSTRTGGSYPTGSGLGHLVDQVGGIGGDLGDLIGVHVEDHLALEGGGGVVEVEDDVLAPWMASKVLRIRCSRAWTSTWMVTSSGMWPPLDQLAADLILGLTGGGKADLDLLDADVHQGVKIFQLLLQVHGVHQSLVAVPQVHRTPDRGLGDDAVRPGAALDGLGLEGDVLFDIRVSYGVPPLHSAGGQNDAPDFFKSGASEMTRYHPGSAAGYPKAALISLEQG